MALYDIKNVSKNGHVFVELRGIQTLKPGHKKTIELSDADRYHPNLTALEPDHLEITLHDAKKAAADKAAAEKAAAEKAEEAKKAADAIKPVENAKK